MTKVKKQNQNVTKLKNSIGGKTYQFEMWPNLKTQIWQNSKTQNVAKLKNSKYDTTQKLKMWPNSETKNVTKLKKIVTKLKN